MIYENRLSCAFGQTLTFYIYYTSKIFLEQISGFAPLSLFICISRLCFLCVCGFPNVPIQTDNAAPLPPYQTDGGSVSGKSHSAALCSLLAGFFPTAIGERERRAAAALRRRERLTRVFRHNEAANTFHRVSRSVFLSAIQQFVKCRALHIQHFHGFCSCNISRFYFRNHAIPIFRLLCFRSA